MGDASVAMGFCQYLWLQHWFQSPSHGGRFCCDKIELKAEQNPEVSVPFPWGTLLLLTQPQEFHGFTFRFSPLPMGDASVALYLAGGTPKPDRVSVPFPWGTLLLLK